MVIIGRSHWRSFQPASKPWANSPARGKIPRAAHQSRHECRMRIGSTPKTSG
jgi:hypothetical protein